MLWSYLVPLLCCERPLRSEVRSALQAAGKGAPQHLLLVRCILFLGFRGDQDFLFYKVLVKTGICLFLNFFLYDVYIVYIYILYGINMCSLYLMCQLFYWQMLFIKLQNLCYVTPSLLFIVYSQQTSLTIKILYPVYYHIVFKTSIVFRYCKGEP